VVFSVGVIGATGRVARSRHLEGALVPLRSEGVVDRVVLAGRNPDALRAIADDLEVGSTECVDIATVLRDPTIEVILVASPPTTHAELCRQVLSAGKHLVVEKPVDLDSGVAERLYEQARASAVCATMVMDKAFSGGYLALTDALQKFPPEDVLAVSGEFGYYVDSGLDLQHPAQRPSWNYRSRLGGSLSADIFSHWSYMLEIVGRPVQVQAMQSTRVTERRDESGVIFPVDVPDWLQVSGLLHTGVPFSIESSWVRRPPSPFRMRVDTSDASFLAEVSGLTVFAGSGFSVDAGRTLAIGEVTDEFYSQWKHFLSMVAAGAADADGLLRGARAAAFVEAIDRSAASGSAVRVQEVASS